MLSCNLLRDQTYLLKQFNITFKVKINNFKIINLLLMSNIFYLIYSCLVGVYFIIMTLHLIHIL